MLEQARLILQSRLDAGRTQSERNRLGQFATPPALALEILRQGVSLLPEGCPVRFLDPATGTGAFYSALRAVVPPAQIEEAAGFEVDPHYGDPAAHLWRACGFDYCIEDFTLVAPAARFNLLVCNPPYVRHHHLNTSDKLRLREQTLAASGMKLSGLAGLYCYFMGLSHAWLEDGGVAGWLIPSEFMDVNYGAALRQYLLQRVTLLHVHRFDPRERIFADAVVSSAVLWIRKSLPPADHTVHFTFGGSMTAPRITRRVQLTELARETKWTRFPAGEVRAGSKVLTLGELFMIRRGLATGNNRYFILSAAQIHARGLQMQAFRPILPGPRFLPDDIVDAHEDGAPSLSDPLYLLDTRLPEPEIQRSLPALADYLREGRAQGIDQRYLCRHRSPWYSQEQRPPAPILCTYLGRSGAARRRPFRFIRNHSLATAANVYLLMYPTPLLQQWLADSPPGAMDRIWEALNGMAAEELLGQGRVYGGGLHKLEPMELGRVPVPQLERMIGPASAARAV